MKTQNEQLQKILNDEKEILEKSDGKRLAKIKPKR
jgi:hypothetical protein